MGREVTGVCAEHKPFPVKMKPNVASHDAGQEISVEVSGMSLKEKDHQVKEGAVDNTTAGNHEENQEILSVKSTNVTAKQNEVKLTKVGDQKSMSRDKPMPGSATVGRVRVKNPVQKPIYLASEKRASLSPLVTESPVAGENSSPNEKSTQSPISVKKSQLSSPSLSRKHLDIDDNWSLASSTAASVRTTRSRTTVPVAPTFKSAERIEKRKEFYAKLEEKHKALEVEQREYESRTKEEEQAAIKQLRKTMVVRANPVPDFYYTGPPPKKELKKLPTTRAVSPKLGRRKSCSDAVRSSSEERTCSRAHRYSMGGNNKGRASTTTPITPRRKDELCEHSGNGNARTKDSSNPKEEAVEAIPEKIEQTDSDITAPL